MGVRDVAQTNAGAVGDRAVGQGAEAERGTPARSGGKADKNLRDVAETADSVKTVEAPGANPGHPGRVPKRGQTEAEPVDRSDRGPGGVHEGVHYPAIETTAEAADDPITNSR